MQNKDVIRKAYDLFSEGRMEEAGELFAPDVVWSFPGKSRLAGEYRGRDAVVGEFLPKFPKLSGGTFRASVVDIADGAEHSFVLQRSQAERDGSTIDYTACHVFKVEDGLIRTVHTYPYDAHAQEEFWG
jgi:ketosteroid isomerase-like protein